MRIESLTAERERLLPHFRQEWLEIGTCTEPAGRPRAESAVTQMYRILGNESPEYIWCDSPATALLTLSELSISPHRSLDSSLHRSLYRSLASSLASNWRWAHRRGQHEGYWVAFYRFCEEIGVEYEPKDSHLLGLWEDLSRSCGWWWPFESLVVVTERPKLCRVEPTGDNLDSYRLHREDGPALLYRDGWPVYSWHGVMVPREVIEAPETLGAKRISSEPNAEVRRIMMERYGYDRYLREAGARLVHEDDWGKLWRLEKAYDPEPLTMVEVENSTPDADGSYRKFFLRVHPQICPLLSDGAFGAPQSPTALNAVASTFGMKGKEYAQGMVAQT